MFASNMTRAVNFAFHAERGFLPCGNGLLNQSEWFLNVLNSVTAEQSRLMNQRFDRMARDGI
jgi:hypothetical protein